MTKESPKRDHPPSPLEKEPIELEELSNHPENTLNTYRAALGKYAQADNLMVIEFTIAVTENFSYAEATN